MDVFSQIKSFMNYTNKRNVTLAQNIANANTSGYIAKDIKRPDFKSQMKESMGITAMRTNSNHISLNNGNSGHFKVYEDRSGDITQSGNNVEIDMQMLKISENSADHQKATAIYKKFIGMIKRSISTTA